MPADELKLLLEEYRAQFGDSPTIMGYIREDLIREALRKGERIPEPPEDVLI